jgi:hypothetical protein
MRCSSTAPRRLGSGLEPTPLATTVLLWTAGPLEMQPRTVRLALTGVAQFHWSSEQQKNFRDHA